MKRINSFHKILLVFAILALASCEDHLTELNIDPNGVDPDLVQPNLVVPTVISQTAHPYLQDNYEGWVAGTMQYVQKSGWGSELNKYDWNKERGWDTWYANLRNAKHLYERSMEEGMEFQQGVALVMRAFNYGYIVDSWGDAPYANALNAPDGGQGDLFPTFDSQETIYKGIIEELKEANTLLSKPAGAYKGIQPNADILYSGNPELWRKFANSLMLRYYMRLSEKLPDYAKQGIEEIMSNASSYPVFASFEEDAMMSYVGSSNADSWPANVTYDASASNFNRIQLCAGFRDVLVGLEDPRLDVWFNPVKMQIKVSEDYEDDVVVDGVRYLNPTYMAENNMVLYAPDTWVDDAEAGKVLVDTMVYVGLPIASTTGDGSGWNLNPNPIQGGPNVHNSALDDIYMEAEGDLLKARLMSYAEVCFILAEAAQKGWNVGDQQSWYEKGIKASLNTWEVGDAYDDYVAVAGVAFDGSIEQIMEQKWIANWTVAHEAWCDWRRTGLPQLTVGKKGVREAMPLRFQYGASEKDRNNVNYDAAIQNLQETDYTATDGEDSAWSKFWLLQGTNKPY